MLKIWVRIRVREISLFIKRKNQNLLLNWFWFFKVNRHKALYALTAIITKGSIAYNL